MGCSFNHVIVPPKVQKDKDLLKFYEEHRQNLIENYGGEEFEGYSGDMASDNGNLIIMKELKLDAEGTLSQEDVYEYFDELMDLCGKHCVKWGPSIAVRIGGQWVICGAYSD